MFYNWREFTSRASRQTSTSWKKGSQTPNQRSGEGILHSLRIPLTYCPALPLPSCLEALPLAEVPLSFVRESFNWKLAFVKRFFKHTVCSLKPLVPARVLEVNSCHPGKCPSFPQLSLTYSSLYTWLSLNTVTAWDWTSQSLRGLWHAYADGKQACGQEKACRQEENQISLQRGRWKGTSLQYRGSAWSPVALLSRWAGHPENRTQAPSDIFRVPNLAHCLPELCLALCTWKMALWDSFRGKHAFIKLLDQIASLLPSFFFMRHDGLLHLWLKKSVIDVVAFSVSLGGDHDIDAQRNWRMVKRRHVLIYRELSSAHCWPRGSCSNGPLLSWLDWHDRSEGRRWTNV